MSLKMMNEAFKRKYESVLTEKPEQQNVEDELRNKLTEIARNLLNNGEDNLKAYEIAFQDAIEDMFPDHSWWEVTDCNIFMELLNTRNVMSTIDTIIDGLNKDVLNKYSLGKMTEDTLNKQAMRVSKGSHKNKHNKIKESKLKHTSTRNKKLHESVNHKSHKRLNEGPGAGYTIESSGYRLDGEILDFKIYNGDYDTEYDCRVSLSGTVDHFVATSGEYGTGEVDNLSIVCKEVTLTYPKEDDIRTKDELLEDMLDALVSSSCSFVFGGGRYRQTYDGRLTDDGVLDSRYGEISAKIYLSNKDDIKKVIRLTSGDGNYSLYEVFVDEEFTNSFEDVDDAIEYAAEINADYIYEVFVSETWDGHDTEIGDIIWENPSKNESLNRNKHKKLKESPSYEMRPQHDARKSFYGKARVDDENGVKTLYSYDTPVAKIDNGKVELLPKWESSQTTLRHVKEFLKQNGFKADSLAQMKKDYK